MSELANYSFLKRHFRSDDEFEELVRETTSLAQENVARLSSEVDAIEELNETYGAYLRATDQEWLAYLDWQGQRIIRTIESKSDECTDSIRAITGILFQYSRLLPE